MFVKTKAVVLILMVILVSSLSAGVIPSDLQWPLKNKGVQDTSIFFDTEDAVESSSKDRTHCSGGHFVMHAGHDIIANVGTKVYPVYDGIVRESKGSVNGGGWGARVVIEHTTNGKKWTSVYWHLQDKDLVKDGTKVTKSTVIGKVVKTTNMKDVNHLHIGLRPLKYDAVSKDGFGGCKSSKNKDYLLGFEDPLNYLPRPYYKLMDDKNGWYKSSWKKSNTLDMYSGVGYKETMAYWNDSIAVLFHQKDFPANAKYKIYAKFPVSNTRSEKSYYLLFVNKKYAGGRIVDQSDFNHRGHNVYLFTGDFKIDDEIHLLIANKDKNKYMSSDALLFIRQ